MAARKFTKALVGRIVSGAEGVGTWTDTETRLGIKRTPAGATSYRLVLKVGGKARTFTPRDPDGKPLKDSARHLTLEQARAWAKETVARLTLGEGIAGPAVPERRITGPTFAKVADRYLTTYTAAGRTPKAIASETYAVSLAGRHLADLEVSVIGPAELTEMVNALGSDAQRRLGWGAAKRVLDRALTEGSIALNPAAGMTAPKPPRSRGRYLSLDEVAKVWRACEQTAGIGAVIHRFLLAMPLRKMEAGRLTWGEVDLDAAEITIIPGKKKEPRRLPLPGIAVELLRAIQPEDPADGDLVFPSDSKLNKGGLFSGWSAATARIRKRAGVRDWTLHDFRRTAATHVVEQAGISISVEAVDAWLTHEQASTATGVRAVYIRATHQRGMRDAADAWDRIVRATLADNVVPMRRAG